jgi:hypothetical protein
VHPAQCTHAHERRQTGGPGEQPDPTCQPHRGEGGAGRADLAAGEVTSSGFLVERRTPCASSRHRRSSWVSLMARMVGRWRGSPTTRRSRPWRGWVRSARGSRSQGKCESTRNWRERRGIGLPPWKHELGGHGAAVPRKSLPWPYRGENEGKSVRTGRRRSRRSWRQTQSTNDAAVAELNAGGPDDGVQWRALPLGLLLR